MTAKQRKQLLRELIGDWTNPPTSKLRVYWTTDRAKLCALARQMRYVRKLLRNTKSSWSAGDYRRLLRAFEKDATATITNHGSDTL